MLDLLAHLLALWLLEAGEGATQDGQQGVECIEGQVAHPGVQRPPESVLVQDKHATAMQHTLYPRGSLRSRRGKGEREPCLALQFLIVQRVLFQQQATATPAHQPMNALALGKLAQDSQPLLALLVAV